MYTLNDFDARKSALFRQGLFITEHFNLTINDSDAKYSACSSFYWTRYKVDPKRVDENRSDGCDGYVSQRGKGKEASRLDQTDLRTFIILQLYGSYN